MCNQSIYQVTCTRHDDSKTWDVLVTLENAPWPVDPIVDLQGIDRSSPVIRAINSLLDAAAEEQLCLFDLEVDDQL